MGRLEIARTLQDTKTEEDVIRNDSTDLPKTQVPESYNTPNKDKDDLKGLKKKMMQKVKSSGYNKTNDTKSNHEHKIFNNVSSESNIEMIAFNNRYINNEQLNCTEGFLTKSDGVIEVNIQDIMERDLLEPKASKEVDVDMEAKRKREAVMDNVEATISKMFGLDASPDNTTAKPTTTHLKRQEYKPKKNPKKLPLKVKKFMMNKNRNMKNLKLRSKNDIVRLGNNLRRDFNSNTKYKILKNQNGKKVAIIGSSKNKIRKPEPPTKQAEKVNKPEISSNSLKCGTKNKPIKNTYKFYAPKTFYINNLELSNKKILYSPEKKNKLAVNLNQIKNSTIISKSANENVFTATPSPLMEGIKPDDCDTKTRNKSTKSIETSRLNKKADNTLDDSIGTWRKRQFTLSTVVKVWEIKPDPQFGLKNAKPAEEEKLKPISRLAKEPVNCKTTRAHKINPPDLAKLNAAIPKDLTYVDFVKKYEENKKIFKKMTENYKADINKRRKRKRLPTAKKQLRKNYNSNKDDTLALKDLEDILECNIIMSDRKENMESDTEGEDESSNTEIVNQLFSSSDDDEHQANRLDATVSISEEDKNSDKLGTKDDFCEDKIRIFERICDQFKETTIPAYWKTRCTEFGITFIFKNRLFTVSANLDLNIEINNRKVELIGAPKNVTCMQDLLIVLDILSEIDSNDSMLDYT